MLRLRKLESAINRPHVCFFHNKEVSMGLFIIFGCKVLLILKQNYVLEFQPH